MHQNLEPPLNQPGQIQPCVPDHHLGLHLNILIASIALGGAERNVYDTIIGLRHRKPSGKLFLMHHVTPSYNLEDTHNFRVFQLGSLSRSRRLERIALEVLASPTPVLFTHLIRASELKELWHFGIITIPVIQNSKPGWHDPAEAYNHPNVPFIVSVSEAIASELRRECNKPVVVVRHELQRWLSEEELQKNRDRIRQQYGIPKDTLLIGMVGQFKSHKAYPRAVRVLKQVQQFFPSRLMILGGWDHSWGAGRVTYTATCRKALELGVTPDLILPGSVDPVDPYYAAFDVFLNTSIYEGLSVATLEAIQSGCPVITANAGGQREALQEHCVLIDDPSDISAYAEAIRSVYRRHHRTVVPPPTKPDLIPRLWCLLGKHGIEQLHRNVEKRIDTFIITSNLNPGGAQRSLTNLLTHLPFDHKTMLCVMGKVLGEGYVSALQEKSVPVVALDHSASMLDRVEQILDLLEKVGAPTICFWNLDSQIKLVLTKVLEHRTVRIVDVSPGPMLFNEMEQQISFQRRICYTAQQYFSRLDTFVSKYNDGGPPPQYKLASRKFVNVPNGVPVPPKTARRKVLLPSDADPEFTLITCCRIVPNKRLEWLVDMMGVLTARLPQVTLTVVGGVDQRHIPYWNTVIGKIQRSGLSNMFFPGAHSDVFSFLDQFKVFVMISNSQGCPNASLEAMAMGLPVVANSDGGTAEQIQQGVNGFLVSGDYPSEMAERVEFLLRNPEIARRFGEAGKKIVRKNFPMSLMVNRYLCVFNGSNTVNPVLDVPLARVSSSHV